MTFPTNYTPPWLSYIDTQNPADIVKSTAVATALGAKVDATNGQLQTPNIQGGTITGSTLSGVTLPIATTAALGVVEVGSGLNVAAGVVSIAPATSGAIGGVKPGTNLSVAGDGTLTTTGLVTISGANSTYVPFTLANSNGGYVGLDSSGNAVIPGTFGAGTGALAVTATSVVANQATTVNAPLTVTGNINVDSNSVRLKVGGTYYALTGTSTVLSYAGGALLSSALASSTYVPFTQANSASGYVGLDASSNASIAGTVTSIGFNLTNVAGTAQPVAYRDGSNNLILRPLAAGSEVVIEDYAGVLLLQISDTFTTSGPPIRFPVFTLATLPSATTFNGGYITVSDATGGPKLCVSDGTNWKIINTTVTVS